MNEMNTKCETRKLDVNSYKSKMESLAKDMLMMLECVDLPGFVNEALTEAFEKMPTSSGETKALEHLFEPEKAAEHEKYIFTYATRFGQFKLIKDGNEWKLRSEISYFDKELDLPILLQEISNDVELLDHLLHESKRGDVSKFLE